jgi:ribosomal protein S18 acetylase RimI-like enzyme
MAIRLAREDEVKVLQNLNDEVFVDNHKYDPDLKTDWAQSETGRKYFTEALNNPETICLIAEEDNKPVGYLVAAPKDFGYRLSKYLEIENMGVSANFRSKGIGVQLVNKCLELAKKMGYQKVYVNAYFENTKAIAFYEKCGLKKIDISLEKDI